MAKKKAVTKKKLMPHKEVTVKSRTYGEHTRAARGSKTPVGLNEAFAAHNAKTVAVNSTAKRVHDLIKHCGEPFKEAMLWQEMLSRMRKAGSDNMVDLLTALNGMELNSKYPLERFMHLFAPSVRWNRKSSCDIILRSGMPPRIKSNDTMYACELYLLILSKEPAHDTIMSRRTEWMEKEKSIDGIALSLEVPRKMMYYVLCLHLMTGKNGKETGTLASRGMKIIGAGKM